MPDSEGISRRSALKLGAGAAVAGAAGVSLFNINHAWSQDVYYDGEVFDAGGATLRVGGWGGQWEEVRRKVVLDPFAEAFNCKIAYDPADPWFPKYIASGPQNPPFSTCTSNLFELYKIAKAGDYFVPVDEVRANVPRTSELVPFSFESGFGVTYVYEPYVYMYRTDAADTVNSFQDFWKPAFANRRGTYATWNELQQTFFMTAAQSFGGDYKNIDAGLEAMRKAMPLKLSDYTGNMMTLVERGEVDVIVLTDGEFFLMKNQGVPVEAFYWGRSEGRQPIITLTEMISKYIDPIEKKLAYAHLDWLLRPETYEQTAEFFPSRPTNTKAKLPKVLTDIGVTNSAEELESMWNPDFAWYLENEERITEEVNAIFAV